MDRIFDSIFDAEWTGRRGEKLCERELNLVRFLGRDGKVLRNAYIPKAKGGTSEIDVLFVTVKGIFVIESKNYSGWIFGDEGQRNWTAVQKGGHKDRFYNPIMQNKTHMRHLAAFLGDGCPPLFSVIAFSERCELKKISVESGVPVINRDRLYKTVRNIWNDSPDALSGEQVERLVNRLEPLTHATAAEKASHVEDIKRRFG